MMDVYFWTTPNGYKVLMMLEETELDYTLHGVNISTGDQFKPEFLEISPNNRIPALVDHDPKDEAGPLSVFESGAILEYLGDKTGQFLPGGIRARYNVLQWLYWQMGGLGPMAGQNHHFSQYAPVALDYAINRYVDETARLYGVLNKQIGDRDFITENYSIADMACYPWVVSHEKQNQDLNNFPNVKRWFENVKARPATVRAYAKGAAINNNPTVSEDAKKILFGQNAATVR